jgi:hypothetical protein
MVKKMLLLSFKEIHKCHPDPFKNRSIFNLDRTCPSRKNSDFSRVNFLPSSAATALYILINIGWQQQNRTQLVNLVNFRLESEKFRSVLQVENTKAPATRRHPAGSVKGARFRTIAFLTARARARRQASHLRASARARLVAPSSARLELTGGLTQ